MRLLLLLATGLWLLGCPKRADTRVAGSADEQMDQWAAELEELRALAGASQGPGGCSLANRACPLAEQTCRVAAGQPGRDDFQGQCGRAQEDCAHYRHLCTRDR